MIYGLLVHVREVSTHLKSWWSWWWWFLGKPENEYINPLENKAIWFAGDQVQPAGLSYFHYLFPLFTHVASPPSFMIVSFKLGSCCCCQESWTRIIKVLKLCIAITSTHCPASWSSVPGQLSLLLANVQEVLLISHHIQQIWPATMQAIIIAIA